MTDVQNQMPVRLLPAFGDNYLFVVPEADGTCFVVDPGDAEVILSFLDSSSLRLAAILITHHHADHIGGVRRLVEVTGCTRVHGPSYDLRRIPGITEPVRDGDRIVVCGHEAVVRHTPGHTSGHVCYHFAAGKALFCGDTLFSAGCGRMFEGTQEEMWASLQILAGLPDDTAVYCAHEYTLSNIRFAVSVDPANGELAAYARRCEALRASGQPTIPSSIGIEKKINPFLLARNASAFGDRRRAKDVF
jgi:hydroxyacylglutathione hydrolase